MSEALQQRILADPALAAGLVPRRKTWTGAVADGAAFVGHCDGGRMLAEIAAETGTGMERASAALAVAVRRGLLTHDLCPPATVCDPLGWLRERLSTRTPVSPPPSGAPGLPGRGRVRGADACECGLTRAEVGEPPGVPGLAEAGERSGVREPSGALGFTDGGERSGVRDPSEALGFTDGGESSGVRESSEALGFTDGGESSRVWGPSEARRPADVRETPEGCERADRPEPSEARGCAGGGSWRRPGRPGGGSWPPRTYRRSAGGPGRSRSRTRSCRRPGASTRSANCSPITPPRPPM
ncbi:hypothetical protein ACFQYP_10940 [Nonomuraea antimicrobica]